MTDAIPQNPEVVVQPDIVVKSTEVAGQISDADLLAKIHAVSQAVQADEKAANDALMQTPVVPVTPTDAAPVPEPVVTEKPEPVQGPFAELQAKSGIKSADELARSYQELRKAFTKSRMQEARKAPEQAPQAPVIPSVTDAVPSPDINERVLQQLGTDPARVLMAAGQIAAENIIGPIREQLAEAQLEKAVGYCSRVHKDFNYTEIQAEIQKIVQARPEYLDNLAGNMEDLYYMARGRIMSAGPVLNPQSPTQPVPPVEKPGRAIPPQGAIPFDQMSAEQQKAFVEKAWVNSF